MLTCYHCGKPITKTAVSTNPPLYLIQLGLDFKKSFHPKCYDRAELEATNQLYPKSK